MLDLFSGFPRITGLRWFNLAVLAITPAISLWGLVTHPLYRSTGVASVLYFFFSMLGITAGYHRLWSHRAFNASLPLQLFLMSGATSAVQGSCYWWARRHRSHHRHTDTDLDPYNSNRGLLWTHIGWMVFETDLKAGSADISDLRKDPLVQWQHKWYFPLLTVFGFVLPALIPGLGWGDWKGGFFYCAVLRLVLCHHATFCINSVAHWLGDTPYDDKHTPRDHLISAILTLGEGYHNFHHQFPMDYRNAFKWYQYDPTKWFIAICNLLGLATQLKVFPSNEIEKGALSMKLKKFKEVQDSLTWPIPSDELPVVQWETFQEEAKSRLLVLVGGFIHDLSGFADKHPGGKAFITSSAGKDVTASFFGGVYAHSHAAHNLLSMMRVGILSGGVEVPAEHSIPPSQKLYIAQATAAR
ncbi:hypothetical protein BOTBODRAFT_186520 [Botryobasidium botryosum FD-172 SS1]|uniref:Acyl-CoA desaturase n=1 Tax=Botryobasidium botryosum (strain FD-172 SS1) TaxID=930990 RepID=A0A067MY78_BOTB1|nr:hypothetical protein BOTBODRAFT_186520 [Botryobasidium botryosum FD-172 SS1]